MDGGPCSKQDFATDGDVTHRTVLVAPLTHGRATKGCAHATQCISRSGSEPALRPGNLPQTRQSRGTALCQVLDYGVGDVPWQVGRRP
jgi:hypothetical protein